MKKKRLYLVDGAGFYYRAFYGIRQNLAAPDGTPTNAVYGFARMFSKILREEKPDALAIALDSRGKTFRHEMYPEYKAHRQKMPEELSVQLPYIEKLIDALNVAVMRKEGLEADDLIGTAAIRGMKEGYEVTIVSGDKDFMQLVGKGVSIYDPLKERRFDVSGVEEKFGVGPEKVVDILSLMGDSSDNIPGVPGVGEKTALSLIKEYGSMEGVLEHAGDISRPKLRQALLENMDKARLSMDLVKIRTDVEMELDFEAWKPHEPDIRRLNALYAELDFKSMITEERAKPEDVKGVYKAVLEREELDNMISELRKSGGFAVDTETSSTDPMRAELVGLSFSARTGEAYYLPLGHEYMGAPEQLDRKEAIKALKPLLEDAQIEKYGQNIKYDILVLRKEGIDVNPVSFDTMLASYLLNPEDRRHNISRLAEKYIGHRMIEYSDVAGKGAKEIPFSEVEVARATEYSAEDADMTLRLKGILEAELKKESLDALFYEIELPLVKVLADMERNGIELDGGKLERYSSNLKKEMAKLEREIHEAAGEEFNIASPKQLSHILFEKLGLRKVKKTKTGSSTDQQVLEALAMEHELPAMLLRYRGLSKLKTTYVDPLPGMVLPETGRIHTSFNQTIAATGRLSSSSPNLQNIPIRTEEGRRIREAFHARKGWLLISADYSQVELRILAHMSGDRVLTESFENDEDVHMRTAREIFGSLAGEPTQEMRRAAKAVNFGLIYGKTAYGLSQELGVSRKEAESYIRNYFARYSGVKDFIESIKESAREKGYVTTMMGRRRRMPEIRSSNRNVREMAERIAVNTVVQGTAADLIKKAMIDIHAKFEGKKTNMLLQVHDELIFEAPRAEKEDAAAIIRKGMEKVVKLSVPLKVEVEMGENWGELH